MRMDSVEIQTSLETDAGKKRKKNATRSKKNTDYVIMNRCGYLHLTAVVRHNEAEQEQRRKTDDGLECEGVNRALWETCTHF